MLHIRKDKFVNTLVVFSTEVAENTVLKTYIRETMVSIFDNK